MSAILIEPRPGGHIAALVDGRGRLQDLFVDPKPDDLAPRVGEVHRAVMDRPLKGLGGATVRLGGGQTGFLRDSKGVSAGRPMIVQVAACAEPGKAPPVARRVLFKSRYAIATPDAPGVNIARRLRDPDLRARLQKLADAAGAGETGLIVRSQAGAADEIAVAEDIARVLTLSRDVMADLDGPPELLVDAPGARLLAWRDWDAPQIEEGSAALDTCDVRDQIAALGPTEGLAGGGWMAIEPTRAFVAVDVNTAGDTSQAAGLKATLAMAEALPRALRLRGLGGQIVIDPAALPKKERRRVDTALARAFRDDPVETTPAGWSPLGHIELVRRRERRPLSELL